MENSIRHLPNLGVFEVSFEGVMLTPAFDADELLTFLMEVSPEQGEAWHTETIRQATVYGSATF